MSFILPYQYILTCCVYHKKSLKKTSYQTKSFICISYDTFESSFAEVCSSYGCAHMCVHLPSGPKCVCKEGYTLAENNKACVNGIRNWSLQS